MAREISDIDDPRLVKALAHPIRVRIMTILESGTRTPKQLAEELDLPLENVSYHVRTLKDFGFIKLERTRQVRGAVEHHYSASGKPRVTPAAWEKMPTIVKEALVGAGLSAISESVNDAALQDGFARAEAAVVRNSYTVDEQGYEELSAIIDEAVERLDKAGEAARKRLGKDDGINATAVVLLFDTPDPERARSTRGRRRSRSGSTAAAAG